MSTTKTIKIQKNKILTYSINKSGFQTVNKTITVTGDTTITEEMVSTTGSKIQQLGDRLLGISTYVCDFIPSGTYDVDSLKFIIASQTSGIGLTNIQVVKSLWLAQIETVLSIETPKGTSNTFTFTYNGSTWDLTGTTTVSGISATDLGDVYGISFTGTATNGDVITVIETQYNKFACYVLDANYRNGSVMWGPYTLVMPKQYSDGNTDQNLPNKCIESATYYNQYIYDNVTLSSYPLFNYTKNKGKFILPNNLMLNAIVPNATELQEIYNNRIALDNFDPIIQSGTTTYNLTNWSNAVWSCLEGGSNSSWVLKSDGQWFQGGRNYGDKNNSYAVYPIFEVPVM